MTDDRLRSYGVFLLRVALGVMFMAHSTIYMLMTLTLAETAKFFVSIGLPARLAYVTFLAEAVGGILLILGIQTRWVALALSPVLIGATWAHVGNGWVFTAPNGGWEYPLYLFVLCIAQVMLGDGAFALSPSRLSGSGARKTDDRGSPVASDTMRGRRLWGTRTPVVTRHSSAAALRSAPTSKASDGIMQMVN
jgi:putative oxidoreductase